MRNKKQELSSDVCPVCNENLPAHARGRTFHAESHGLTAEELVLKLIDNEPICQCGCNTKVVWRGWTKGFPKYLPGHMSANSRREGSKKLSASLLENHWARGLSKETSEIIREIGKKISRKLKEGFLNGTIKHWSKGLSKETDPRIAKSAKKRVESFHGKNHWHFMSSNEINIRIKSSLDDRFEILSGLESLDDRTNNVSHCVKIKCKSCSTITSATVYNIIRNKKKVCLSCRTEASSVPQLEIEGFIKRTLGEETTVYSSDRSNPTGYELDVYVPGSSFAVEYNGLYWHSDAVQKDKNYHNKKTESCREHGISLLHIFQDEWRDKREIVESMIINRLGLSKKVWARKCSIVKIDNKRSKKFFDDNHIDGDSRGMATYALEFEGNLISAIKLRKPHSKKWSGFLEIARYACVKGVDVIGGHSRLINYIRNNHPERLISYVDTRFGGVGRHCEKSGMILDHISKHSFWWTDRENRFNRLYCKATKENSEFEEALSRKLLKIWGCSNLVYVT